LDHLANQATWSSLETLFFGILRTFCAFVQLRLSHSFNSGDILAYENAGTAHV